jgi:hypothetical protein
VAGDTGCTGRRATSPIELATISPQIAGYIAPPDDFRESFDSFVISPNHGVALVSQIESSVTEFNCYAAADYQIVSVGIIP